MAAAPASSSTGEEKSFIVVGSRSSSKEHLCIDECKTFHIKHSGVGGSGDKTGIAFLERWRELAAAAVAAEWSSRTNNMCALCGVVIAVTALTAAKQQQSKVSKLEFLFSSSAAKTTNSLLPIPLRRMFR